MPGLSDLGKMLLIFGGIIIALGLVFLAASRVPFLGRLPGDILIRRGNTSIFIPIVTCILLSLVLTVAVNLLLLFLRRR